MPESDTPMTGRIRQRPDTRTLPVWNVMVPVLAMIRADSAETAITVLAGALDKCGFELYEDPDSEHTSAFESEREPDGSPYPWLLPAPVSRRLQVAAPEYYRETAAEGGTHAP